MRKVGDAADCTADLAMYGMLIAGRLCNESGDLGKPSTKALFLRGKMVVTKIEVTADAATQEDASCPNWARRDRFLLDSLRYDVYVAAHNGGFWGVWACLECGDHGASLINDSTPDAASTRAQLGLNEHHNRFHRRPRKPK